MNSKYTLLCYSLLFLCISLLGTACRPAARGTPLATPTGVVPYPIVPTPTRSVMPSATPTAAPAPLPTVLPPTPNPQGWLAQTLRVVSDQPIEIRAFLIQPNDRVEAQGWSPNSQALIADHFFGAEQVSSTQMLPNRELWVLHLDGTGRLLHSDALAAAWSPSGNAIAYLQRSATVQKYDLWIAGWPQLAKRQLATNVGLQTSFWQGDNTVVFSSADGAMRSINVNTLQVLPSTNIRAFVDRIQGVNFALSPNGDWLALRSQEQESKLMLIPIRSGNTPWVVPSHPRETYSFIVGNMAWSPDGTRFAFTAWSWDAGGDTIHVVDMHARQEWNLPLYFGRVTSPHFLSWSSDGNVLAFAARNEDTRKTNLYVINVDGGYLRNLSRDKDLYVRSPAWSPDGRYIVYSQYSDGDFTARPRLMQVTPR